MSENAAIETLAARVRSIDTSLDSNQRQFDLYQGHVDQFKAAIERLTAERAALVATIDQLRAGTTEPTVKVDVPESSVRNALANSAIQR